MFYLLVFYSKGLLQAQGNPGLCSRTYMTVIFLLLVFLAGKFPIMQCCSGGLSCTGPSWAPLKDSCFSLGFIFFFKIRHWKITER